MTDAFVIPEEIKGIMEKLEENGYKAYVVGGAVRDMLLNREVHDYDIATSATPDEIVHLFEDANVINANFAVVCHVGTENHGFVEVATFREESGYRNGRPSKYNFVLDIETDLRRRDATINAIAMTKDCDIVDPLNGCMDIATGTVKAVGDPFQRIAEHPIRMMRYLRFACIGGLELDSDLREAIAKNSGLIVTESWEAIGKELMKGLDSERPHMYVHMLRMYGFTDIILPEVHAMVNQKQNVHHGKKSVLMHTLAALSKIKDYGALTKFAVLLHDVGKPETSKLKSSDYGYTFHKHEIVGARMAKDICKRLRLSKRDTKLVCKAVRYHMYPIGSEKAAARFINKVGDGYKTTDEIKDAVAFCFVVRYADASSFSTEERINTWSDEVDLVLDTIEKMTAFSVRDLAVDGHDIMEEFNIEPGELVGDILDFLFGRVLDGVENDKENLLNSARAYMEALK